MLQDLAGGIVIGLGYALIALGLSLIFGVLRIVNFAHGEFYMLGGLFLYSMCQLGLPYFAALAAAVIITVALAAIVDQLVLRPLRKSDEVTVALATLGLSIFLSSGALVIWGPVPHRVPDPFDGDVVEFFSTVFLTKFDLFSSFATFIVFAGAYVVIRFTSAGRQMRAMVQDSDAAALVGLNINRIYIVTFATGCGLAALAGGLLGTMFLIYPAMGLLAVMKAFVVVVIGGMGSIPGAIIGGLLLGIAESLGGAVLPSGYKDIIGFIMIIAVLIARPQGLFGGKRIRIR